MNDRKAMQQALEALNHVNVQDRVQIITALRERLAQPEREPLTDEEIEDIWADCPVDWDDKINVLTLARAIEAAHGIKENT